MNQRPRDLEDTARCPDDNVAHRPKCGGVWNIDIWERNKAGGDLCEKAVQSEVDEAEAKGDASGKSPLPNLRLGGGRASFATGCLERPSETSMGKTAKTGCEL
jgi:hypothetical protein